MQTGRGATITWTSYNLPASITNGSVSSSFSYKPDRGYWRQVAQYAGGPETTIYVGGMLEKVSGASGTDYHHLIRAGSALIVVTRSTGSNNNTYYVTQDHLGSSTAVTNSSGTLLVNESFAAYGARRGANWTGSPTSGDYTQIANSTRRGYTGHTMLDNLSLIHMNGRVYDPMIGRFLSADPYVDDGLGAQGLNRLGYVGNDSLSLVDPMGFKDRRDTKQQIPINPNDVTCPTDLCVNSADVREGRDPGEAAQSMAEFMLFLDLMRIRLDAPIPEAFGYVWDTGLLDGVEVTAKRREPTRSECHARLPDGGTVAQNVQSIDRLMGELLRSSDTSEYAFFGAIGAWTAKVQEGGTWDYKVHGGTETEGNFNYGATGSVMFSPRTLLSAAGAVQLVTNPSVSDGGVPFISPPYGDQIQDQNDIKAGIAAGC